MKRKNILLISIYLSIFSIYSNFSFAQISQKDLYLSWEILENNLNNKNQFLSQFTIVNKSGNQLTSNWNIYFNFPRMIDSTLVKGDFSIRHINGDFFQITPKANFKLTTGDTAKIIFVSDAWAQNQSDAPAGLYIIFKDKAGREQSPEIVTNYSIRPVSWNAISSKYSEKDPGFLTPEGTYGKFSKVQKVSENKLLPIVPSPVSYKYGQKKVVIDPSYSIIAVGGLEDELKYLTNSLNSLLAEPISEFSKNKIELSIAEVNHNGKVLKAGDEAYQLEVKQGKIQIKGTDKDGVFYGIQSLKALLPPSAFKEKSKELVLREISITDYPGFHYRGIHLDVARNFQSKESVLQLLDVAAFYKINKFHFHLTDDEGWRIEIKSLPELTEVGAKRAHSTKSTDVLPSFGSGPFSNEKSTGTGYYTKEEFIEILKYATERHIEVIPELDLPGHSRAAIKSMDARYARLMKAGKPEEAKAFLLRDLQDKSNYQSVQMWNDNVICVCQESTFNFIETVVKEFVGIYKEAGAPLNILHTGGDEVPNGIWEKSPACKTLTTKDTSLKSSAQLPSYFLTRLDKILDKYKLKTAGWEEIALRKEKGENGHSSYVVNPAFVNNDFIPYVWNNINGSEDLAYKLANAGYPVVLSGVSNLYFDMAYNNSPEEIGYYWGGFVDTRKTYEFVPMNVFNGMFESEKGKFDQEKLLKTKEVLTEKGKENILGVQGHLWSENTLSTEIQQYFIFPKLLALSEVAWGKNPAWSNAPDQTKRLQKLDSSYTIFANTLGQKELVRLDYMSGGINYRIAPPGAKIENGMLKANTEFPGFVIRYTTDGSEPTSASPEYKNSVPVKGIVKLKAFASNGRSSRTTTVQDDSIYFKAKN